MTLRFRRAKSLFDLKCSEGKDIISDLTRWPVCKRYLGKQVAKCVNECKSQASEAKKAVQGLTKTKKKRFHVAAGSAGEPEDLDSGDGWSSDEFDTGDEDDGEKDYSNSITEVGFSVSDFGSDNSSTNGPESVAGSEGSGQYNDVTLDIRSSMPGRTAVWNLKGPSSGRELDTASPEPSVVLKSMSRLQSDGGSSPPLTSPEPSPNPRPSGRSPKPKTPTHSPVSAEKMTPKANNVSGGGNNVVQRRFMSKLQRPHSLPPAPPPPRVIMEQEVETLPEEKCWEYEIPNSGIPVQQRPSSPTDSLPPAAAPVAPLRHRTHSALVNGDTPHRAAPPDRRSLQETVHRDLHNHRDTYENVDKHEEGNYESVDDERPAVQPHGPVVTPASFKPFVPPRKPASLPPHLLPAPSTQQQQTNRRNSPANLEPLSSPEATATNFPSSEGPDSRRPMNLLINEFRTKLSQLGVNRGDVSADRAHPAASTPQNGPLQKVHRRTSVCSADSECADADPVPPLPLSRPPDQAVGPPAGEDSCSMSVRPLPPVPSSQQKRGEDLSQLPYYVNVERDEAERRLLFLGQDDAYLVRPSRRGGSENPHTLTLIHKGRPFHLNIRLRPDGLYALGRKKEQEVVFGSITSLVCHHQNYPIYLSAQGATVGTSLLKRHP